MAYDQTLPPSYPSYVVSHPRVPLLISPPLVHSSLPAQPALDPAGALGYGMRDLSGQTSSAGVSHTVLAPQAADGYPPNALLSDPVHLGVQAPTSLSMAGAPESRPCASGIGSTPAPDATGSGVPGDNPGLPEPLGSLGTRGQSLENASGHALSAMFGPSLVTRSPVTGFERQLPPHLIGQLNSSPNPSAPNHRSAGSFAASHPMQPPVPLPSLQPLLVALWYSQPVQPPYYPLNSLSTPSHWQQAPTFPHAPPTLCTGEDLLYRVMSVNSAASGPSVLSPLQRQQIDCLLANRSRTFLSQSVSLLSSSNYFAWEPALCNVLQVARMHAHLENGLMTPSEPLDIEVCQLLEHHAINLVCSCISCPILRKLDPLSRFSSLRSLWDTIAALLLDVGIMHQVAMFRRAMNHNFRKGLQKNAILDTILEQTKLAVSGGALTEECLAICFAMLAFDKYCPSIHENLETGDPVTLDRIHTSVLNLDQRAKDRQARSSWNVNSVANPATDHDVPFPSSLPSISTLPPFAAANVTSNKCTHGFRVEQCWECSGGRGGGFGSLGRGRGHGRGGLRGGRGAPSFGRGGLPAGP